MLRPGLGAEHADLKDASQCSSCSFLGASPSKSSDPPFAFSSPHNSLGLDDLLPIPPFLFSFRELASCSPVSTQIASLQSQALLTLAAGASVLFSTSSQHMCGFFFLLQLCLHGVLLHSPS